MQRILFAILLASASTLLAIEPPADKAVSYFKDIRPIFQANCQGCHQPSKSKGNYVMTDFKRMLEGGESKDNNHAIVAGSPDKSLLIEMITPDAGAAESEMPKNKPALSELERSLVKRWIAEGANDDTPLDAVKHFDAEHPPVYTAQPVVTSIDFSPNGQLIAVAGYHEILLHKADGSGLAGRLIGISERIEKVRFSPDGALLAAAGGSPARMGEIQIWNVAEQKLAVSAPVSYDTLYGVSWSPDGKTVAFGCPDNTVRVIETATGKQVLQQGSHNDWVLDTTWDAKGANIISVGRDMTAKLTEVVSQRFVDNLTSITPGALKGGMHAIERHPKLDQVLIGGSDGAPQTYRIFRLTPRVIGDNANLVRRFGDMPGRIFSVRYSLDGNRFAACSSLDNVGQVVVYEFAPPPAPSDEIKAIASKKPEERIPAEKEKIENFESSGIQQIAKADIAGAGVYSVAFSPDAKTLAAAGQDGRVRLINADNGSFLKEFDVAILAPAATAVAPQVAAAPEPPKPATPESLTEGAQITALEVQPPAIELHRRNDYVQLSVTAKLASGDSVDVTRLAKFELEAPIARLSSRGLLEPRADGATKLNISMNGQAATVPVTIAGLGTKFHADYVMDVSPVLTRLGCNGGLCHGAKDGKAGFKLSLRGYDPIYDVRAFTDDLASRRVNTASPDDSLMLLKTVAEVPHEGGRRTTIDTKYYHILRQWIADGAKLNQNSPRVAKIEVTPKNPVVQKIGTRQQVRVIATYTDGGVRDVTAEAFVESGNTEVATAETGGIVSTIRRGEAPVLARFEGAYAATTVTVMGDRTGFVWADPLANNKLDELVAAKWKRMRIQPGELCNDAEFIRRIHLDLTGLPPTAEAVRGFLADARDTKVKRDELIDKLIGSPDFIEHMTNKWADLLQVNSKFLGGEGATLFRSWIRDHMEKNTPYDQFVREILTASGSNKTSPPASYFKILRTPAETMENTTHLFLATRFNCNKCHDHPFERWTMDNYYQTASYFAQVGLEKDPVSGEAKLGGTDVEAAKPLYEIVKDTGGGEVKHERTQKNATPAMPFPATHNVPEAAPRRQQLAAWITASDNRYFATSYVNRLWGYLLGVGIIEPIDDIRAGNPPTNPELLDHLAKEFVANGFNVRHMIRLICQSRAYQLSIKTNRWNDDDGTNYSHALPRRLPAEVLFDTVFAVTGAQSNINGVAVGTRSALLTDSKLDVPSGLLANLGRPARESACECERSNDLRLGSVMSLLSGPTVSEAINNADNAIAKLVAAQPDDRKLIDELFVRILARPATDAEIDGMLKSIGTVLQDHQKLAALVAEKERAWAPIAAQKEAERQAAIAAAKIAVDAHEKEIAPQRAEMEKKRLETIAANEKAVQESEASLAARQTAWEATLTVSRTWATWHPVDAMTVTATKGATLQKLPDGSVLAGGANGTSVYEITGETGLAGITGLMLEVLPHESHVGFGPGRSGANGNFVLTEIQFAIGKKEKPEERADVKFIDARVDFNQQGFEPMKAIDGKLNGDDNGWAIHPAPVGNPHWITCKIDKPVGEPEGTGFKLKLHQNYGPGSHLIGRFRLWLTTSPAPLEQGLPAVVLDAVKQPPQVRSAEQQAALAAYYHDIDAELRTKQQVLFVSRPPLAPDARLVELRLAFEKTFAPVAIDPQVIAIRNDLAASERQLANHRLTGAQDVAWALINNPSFLFNR